MEVKEIEKDGLPDMDNLVGRVAFIFDGNIVSGWPLKNGNWEANSDVGRVEVEYDELSIVFKGDGLYTRAWSKKFYQAFSPLYKYDYKDFKNPNS